MWRRLLIVTGLAALAAYFLRRRRPAVGPHVAEIDPADELRRKLDEVRASEVPEVAEPEGTTEAADLDARRRGVHDRARRAADEMQQSSSDPS